MDKYKKNSKKYFATKIMSIKKKKKQKKTLKIADTSTKGETKETHVSNPQLELSEVVKKTNNKTGRNKNKSKLLDL